MTTKPLTPLTQLFRDLVADLGKQTGAAKTLGVAQSTVSGWVTGGHRMSWKTARRAEKATGGKYKATDLCPDEDFDSKGEAKAA